MVAKGVKETATPTETLKRAGSNRVKKDDSATEKGMPATGPFCDLNMAACGSEVWQNVFNSEMALDTTGCFELPTRSLTAWLLQFGFTRFWAQASSQCRPFGHHKPFHTVQFQSRILDSHQTWRIGTFLQGPTSATCRPNSPMGHHTRLFRVPQPQTTNDERQSCGMTGNLIMEVLRYAQDSGETLPQTGIVPTCKEAPILV